MLNAAVALSILQYCYDKILQFYLFIIDIKEAVFSEVVIGVRFNFDPFFILEVPFPLTGGKESFSQVSVEYWVYPDCKTFMLMVNQVLQVLFDFVDDQYGGAYFAGTVAGRAVFGY